MDHIEVHNGLEYMWLLALKLTIDEPRFPTSNFMV